MSVDAAFSSTPPSRAASLMFDMIDILLHILRRGKVAAASIFHFLKNDMSYYY